MHECPECGQHCDCDGEDTWIGWPVLVDCVHECELDDDDDDLLPDDDDCPDDPLSVIYADSSYDLTWYLKTRRYLKRVEKGIKRRKSR